MNIILKIIFNGIIFKINKNLIKNVNLPASHVLPHTLWTCGECGGAYIKIRKMFETPLSLGMVVVFYIGFYF